MKVSEEHGRKQRKKTEEHGKELIKYNELNKNDFTINKDGVFKKTRRNTK